MDASKPPLGERARREILAHVEAVGDGAETDYLEVKSDVDLTTPGGIAKIAKFLLGAANRIPADAERHFGGYAVMVLGAAESAGASGGGLPPERLLEPHELEEKLRPYLGGDFPSWDLERTYFGDGRQVVFIIAAPPENGQGLFPCRKSLQISDKQGKQKAVLIDGAIYVRTRSSTRAALSGEIDALNTRARAAVEAGPDAVESAIVSISGAAHHIPQVVEWVAYLHDRKEEDFVNEHMPAEAKTSSPFRNFGPAIGSWGTALPKDALRKWQQTRDDTISSGRAHLLAHTVASVEIAVATERWIPHPELRLTFRNCELIDISDHGTASSDEVVPPVELDMFKASLLGARPAYVPTAPPSPTAPYVSWKEVGDDVVVSARHPGLRPGSPWVVADEFIVLARDARATTVAVEWVLTQAEADAPRTGSEQLAVVTEDLKALWKTFEEECIRAQD